VSSICLSEGKLTQKMLPVYEKSFKADPEATKEMIKVLEPVVDLSEKGSSTDNNKTNSQLFDEEVTKYMSENKVDYNQAIVAVERNNPEYRFRKMASELVAAGEYNIYGAGQVGDYLYKVNFNQGQDSFTSQAEGFKPSAPVTNVKLNGNTLLVNFGNLTRLYNKANLEDYFNVTIIGAQNTVANLDSSKIGL
jgi:hypothetical protein